MAARRVLVLMVAGVLTFGVAVPADGHGPSVAKDSPTVANPIVHGPITNGIRGGAYNRSRLPLVNGYLEEEFFFEGTARDADGLTAPYKSRILVRRPSDPAASTARSSSTGRT